MDSGTSRLFCLALPWWPYFSLYIMLYMILGTKKQTYVQYIYFHIQFVREKEYFGFKMTGYLDITPIFMFSFGYHGFTTVMPPARLKNYMTFWSCNLDCQVNLIVWIVFLWDLCLGDNSKPHKTCDHLLEYIQLADLFISKS